MGGPPVVVKLLEGTQGIVIGSLIVLSITFGLTLWLGSRKPLCDSHPAPVEGMEG